MLIGRSPTRWSATIRESIGTPKPGRALPGMVSGAAVLALLAYAVRYGCGSEYPCARFVPSVAAFAVRGTLAGGMVGVLLSSAKQRIAAVLVEVLAGAAVYGVVPAWVGPWPLDEPAGLVTAVLAVGIWPLIALSLRNTEYRHRTGYRGAG